MKKIFVLLLTAVLLLSAAGCGSILVDTNTPKSSELSGKYDFYEKVVNKIRVDMKITPEQSDEVFIALVQSGLDGKVNTISESGKEDSRYYKVYASNGDYKVYLKDGVVKKIMQDMDILYPEYKPYDFLSAQELTVKEIKKNGSVVGKYAYVDFDKSRRSKITNDMFKEFVSKRVKDSGYNWVSIMFSDNIGICFAGSSELAASYGKIDSDGKVIEEISQIVLKDDGTYSLPDFE